MQGVIEPKFTAYQGNHFNLRASQINGGGDAKKILVVRGGLHGFLGGAVSEKHLIAGIGAGIMFRAHGRGGVSLRVKIDHQHFFALCG